MLTLKLPRVKPIRMARARRDRYPLPLTLALIALLALAACGGGGSASDPPAATSAPASTPPDPPPVPTVRYAGWVGPISATTFAESLGLKSLGLCLAIDPGTGAPPPFQCGDLGDFDVGLTGEYSGRTPAGAWTALSVTYVGEIWTWATDSNGNPTGAYTSTPVPDNWPEPPENPGWPLAINWANDFNATDFVLQPILTMTRFTPGQPGTTLVGNWSGAYCNRIACSLSVDADGALFAQDANGATYTGSLSGNLSAVATAVVNGQNGYAVIAPPGTTTFALIATDGNNQIVITTASTPLKVGAVPPPPPPACPVGTTAAPLACTCPPADLNADNGSCVVPPPPPWLRLSAAPNPVNYSASTVLDFQSGNATSCAFTSGWPGSGVLPTGETISSPQLFVTTVFTLVCSGPNGTAVESVTVGVVN